MCEASRDVEQGAQLRIESRVFSLSWVPSDVVTGVARLPFAISLAHEDPPPPEQVADPHELVKDDRIRQANELRAWVEFDEQGAPADFGYDVSGPGGWEQLEFPDVGGAPQGGGDAVRVVQSSGGRRRRAVPHRVLGKPFFRFAAPVAWTTLALTISSDGGSRGELTGASSFPRHWVYGADVTLEAKSAVTDYRRWLEEASAERTPWGAEDSGQFVATAESALERHLSGRIMASKPRVQTVPEGTMLAGQGERDDTIFLVLDGILDVDVGGQTVAEVGPGAIVGERASLEGRRSATLRARTTCRVVALDPSSLSDAEREQIAAGHRAEDE
jgi:hypothetical protein